MPHSLLQQHFGFSEFRPGQQQTIEHLLAGRSAAAIFPTGSGKSLCYQLPALALPNLTLVISPLLALMQDQLAFLHSKGIPAATIDSTQSYEQSQQVMRQVRDGEIKILMISVERLKNERFRNFIGQIPISLLVVDEAHCISEWGHNFRPDYLKLPHYRQSLNIERVLLLTATATPQVIDDMAAKFAIDPSCITATGFYRCNLDLGVEAVSPEQRLPYLQQHLDSRREQPAIVYVTQQQSAEQVATALKQTGHHVAAYHAGLEHPLRMRIQQQFMAGELAVIVATIAFGMGVDKADIRHVIHYDLPKSIENYSQEIGRAGRDGQRSECLVLANQANRSVLENFIYGDTPEQDSIARVLTEVSQAGPQWELMANQLSASSNVRPLPLRTLLVYLEMAGLIESKYSYYAEVKFKLKVTETELANRFQGERKHFVEALFASCQKARIWWQVDFEALYQGYGAERSRALTALDYFEQQGLIELQTKQMTEVYQVQQPLPPLEPVLQQLVQQFASKEHSEVGRIEQMLALLQTPECLSHALADYFGDSAAPQQCGHCSACRGDVATLAAVATPPMASPEQIAQWLAPLQQALVQHGWAYTPRIGARFLTGLPSPWLTKVKARQMPGYGQQEQQPFAQLEAQC
ncbi:RecQ family ATP-dependent DNA helicase [Ferrimonas lipolytica]|uniref:ATP-dependent DNA helicase RecQ n=1 Tax=Ferrimonas lipolytica TaxID=2724191 RepID=A0A6H1UGH3_9GAMM|nr:RecQ family ATP-dependent DNA helicase [Ferrimonas lipolytica]QIZ77700.1 RecQ family ATP-dependent DNA helicase [Ferrimonas lipolytica]